MQLPLGVHQCVALLLTRRLVSGVWQVTPRRYTDEEEADAAANESEASRAERCAAGWQARACVGRSP